jgi:hypothetical protein
MEENRTTKTVRGPTIIFLLSLARNCSLKFPFFHPRRVGCVCVLCHKQKLSSINITNSLCDGENVRTLFGRATESFIVIKINKFRTLEWPSKRLGQEGRG